MQSVTYRVSNCKVSCSLFDDYPCTHSLGSRWNCDADSHFIESFEIHISCLLDYARYSHATRSTSLLPRNERDVKRCATKKLSVNVLLTTVTMSIS